MGPRPTGVIEACELFDVAMGLVEQRFRRENPDADESAVEARVRAWILDRSQAPHGDYSGSDPAATTQPS